MTKPGANAEFLDIEARVFCSYGVDAPSPPTAIRDA